MKHLIKFLVIISVFAVVAVENQMQKAAHELDIDCDGKVDQVFSETLGNEIIVKIMASSTKLVSSLQFGLGQPSRQDAICGVVPKFETSESVTEEVHLNMFDQTMEGYNYSNSCSDLVLSGGECDPITIFYNHNTKELNWWRL